METRHAPPSHWSYPDEPCRAPSPAPRHAAPAEQPPTRGPGAAPPATARALVGSGGGADRSAGRIPRLARQHPEQPRRIEIGRQAAGYRRTRPRGASGDRAPTRLRPRLIDPGGKPLDNQTPIQACPGEGRGRREASVVASFCWERAVVGRHHAGPGRELVLAGDRAQRAGRGLDHPRHRLSQEGVALGRGDRQYCGQLGKQDNCQVAVTLSLANHDASLLYLPEDWAKDQARRRQAKIPETIAFQTKPEIALEQINAARTAGLPQGVVLMDAGYGNDTRFANADHRPRHGNGRG